MEKNCLNCKNKDIKLFEGVYCTLNNLLIGKEIIACSKFEECENLFQYKAEKKIDLFKNIELT